MASLSPQRYLVTTSSGTTLSPKLDEINVRKGTFKELVATTFSINTFTAVTATVTTINSTNGVFTNLTTGALTAATFNIGDLYADFANITQLTASGGVFDTVNTGGVTTTNLNSTFSSLGAATADTAAITTATITTDNVTTLNAATANVTDIIVTTSINSPTLWTDPNTYNLAYGTNTGRPTGQFNTMLGQFTGQQLTTGEQNTFVGYIAGMSVTTGRCITAIGNQSGRLQVSNDFGVYVGYRAGATHTGTGSLMVGYNAGTSAGAANNITALGFNALQNATGSGNIGVGNLAGNNIGAETNNLIIGSPGIAGVSGAITIGTAGTHTRNVQAGIRGITTTAADAVVVMIDSAGQLGTVSSSRSTKNNIVPISAVMDTRQIIAALEPVSFEYNSQPGHRDFGMIAEDVDQVCPDLVVYGAESGSPETIKYHLVPVLLLAEVQRLSAELSRVSAILEAHGLEI